MEELGWCSVEITVFPSLAKSIKTSISTSAVKLSNPEVGSSKMTICGSEISSIPMLTLFLSPPETPLTVTLPIKLSAIWLNLNFPIISATFLFIVLIDPQNVNPAANVKDSFTVRYGSKISSCVMYAHFLVNFDELMSMPFIMTSPVTFELGEHLTLPAIIFSRVVFPAPEEPIRTVSSPGLAYPDTPFKIIWPLFLILTW
ncbi:unnamed protein product [Blepharisma stoltei]|uniref:Uncharacterized protein n=1 Tax=Blepharisma stoltei TaxID=1481888 RepID=A0AAU9JV46_9CILI|nr:unnamed protein product [Blepharisma stoltei]